MIAGTPSGGARLLVALAPRDRDELELAVLRCVASEAGTELLGLLVEDPRLLAHAGSRLAREIVLSGRERPLAPAGLERQWRAQTAKIRRHFETTADRLGWRHDFRVVRGEWLAEVAHAAASADALIVDAASTAAAPSVVPAADLGRLARSPLRAFLVAREGWSRGRGIVAVLTSADEAGAADSPALAAALELARETRSPLVAALIGSAVPHSPSLAATLARAAAVGGVAFEGVVAAAHSPDTAAGLLAAVTRRRPRLLVMPGETADDEALVEALLQGLSSSLLWIRPRRS